MFTRNNHGPDDASKTVPFVKYTSCGNNFVIIDGTQDNPLDESEWAQFAAKATNTSFGIGCDNLLVIQRPSEQTLRAIARNRHYWRTLPDLGNAEYIFRMFEPNGDEASCCGNGLICVADFLRRQYGVINTRIATEIPLPRPNVVSIGSHQFKGSWVNLGFPRKTPDKLASTAGLELINDNIHVIDSMTIQFRQHDLEDYLEESSLTLKCYLAFTGEPHLVTFPDHDFSVPELADVIFGSTISGDVPKDERQNLGSWLVHRIGSFINTYYKHMFPEGVNVNFARMKNAKLVENRCYERGINRETLSCSTGALAAVYVVQQLFAPQISNVDLSPVRCRQEDTNALIKIRQTVSGWRLTTMPYLLFDAVYRIPPVNKAALLPTSLQLTESAHRSSSRFAITSAQPVAAQRLQPLLR